MRKLELPLLLLLSFVVLAACGNRTDESPTAEATEENPTSAPTLTLDAPTEELPTLQSTAYPPLPTPTPPGVDAGYPVFTPVPTSDPYPGGLATIVHPMGLQCEDVVYPDLSAAISSLEEDGIAVVAAEEIGLEVCAACGCATSEHFRVQIYAEDLARALELGWQRLFE